MKATSGSREESHEESHEEGWGRRLEAAGALLLRYGLVTILLWVGALKFAAYEADVVELLVTNSPLLSWLSDIFSVRTLAALLGTFEIVLALLIAARPRSPRASAIGSLGAVALFLFTLTFVFTTPGVWQPGYGFPALSPMPGQFLAKDVALLAIAIWTAGEALAATGPRRRAALA